MYVTGKLRGAAICSVFLQDGAIFNLPPFVSLPYVPINVTGGVNRRLICFASSSARHVYQARSSDSLVGAFLEKVEIVGDVLI